MPMSHMFLFSCSVIFVPMFCFVESRRMAIHDHFVLFRVGFLPRAMMMTEYISGQHSICIDLFMLIFELFKQWLSCDLCIAALEHLIGFRTFSQVSYFFSVVCF